MLGAKTMNFVLKPLIYVSETMNFVLKTMNFVFKTMNFALKSMKFVQWTGSTSRCVSIL